MPEVDDGCDCWWPDGSWDRNGAHNCPLHGIFAVVPTNDDWETDDWETALNADKSGENKK